jgi:hypothetical protein
MKKIATLLLLTQALSSASTLAAPKRLVAWTVANVGRSYITNFDVDQFTEQTQLTDAIKAGLFKKSGGDYAKYIELKDDFVSRYFKKSTSQLVYAKMMEDSHHAEHGSKRVAFKTSESDFYDKVQETEDRILKDLLDQRIGIKKSREQYGQFLKEQNYPHTKSESGSDVYWRWYEAQKERIKTEFYLREVKNYEAYVSLKNQRYYFESPVAVHDFYHNAKEDIETNLEGKKLNNKELYQLMNKNKKWSMITKTINNKQMDTASVEDYATDTLLLAAGEKALKEIAKKQETIRSYPLKSKKLLAKYKDQNLLSNKAKAYLEKFIEDKSNNTNYMLSKLFKLASMIDTNTNLEQRTTEIHHRLNSTVMDILADLVNNKSTLTLEKELDKRLMASVNYEGLDDIDKTIAELLIFSMKFQVKKSSFENRIPVRVTLKEYGNFQVHDNIKKFLKHEWMKEQYQEFLDDKIRWKFDYLTIRLDETTRLSGNEAMEFILGKTPKKDNIRFHDMR